MAGNIADLRVDFDSSDVEDARKRLLRAARAAGATEQAFEDLAREAERTGTRSQRAFRRMSAGAERYRKNLVGIAKVSGAALGALSVATVGIAAKTANMADEIDKAATTAAIGTDRYQTLSYALGQMGIEQGLVNSGLKDMNKNIGEFVASGGGPAKATFDRLGLSSRILSGELDSNEEAFNAIIDRLAQIRDPAIRAAEANKIFGEEAGNKLAGQLGNGTQAVYDLEQQMISMGGVMEESVIQKAVQSKDMVNQMATAVSGQLTNAFWDFMPSADAMGRAFNWLVDD